VYVHSCPPPAIVNSRADAVSAGVGATAVLSWRWWKNQVAPAQAWRGCLAV